MQHPVLKPMAGAETNFERRWGRGTNRDQMPPCDTDQRDEP
jgi:hypothetical protein